MISLILCSSAIADTGIDWTQYPDDNLQSTIDDLTEMLDEAKAEKDRRTREAIASSTLGIETSVLLAGFDGYLDNFATMSGMQHYALELSEKDRDKSLIVYPMTSHCSLSIKQEAGLVKSFQVVSDNDDGSEDRATDIIICFMGALLLTNSYFEEGNTMDELSKIMSDNLEHTYGDVTYRYITGRPFISNVSLEVTPVHP